MKLFAASYWERTGPHCFESIYWLPRELFGVEGYEGRRTCSGVLGYCLFLIECGVSSLIPAEYLVEYWARFPRLDVHAAHGAVRIVVTSAKPVFSGWMMVWDQNQQDSKCMSCDDLDGCYPLTSSFLLWHSTVSTECSSPVGPLHWSTIGCSQRIVAWRHEGNVVVAAFNLNTFLFQKESCLLTFLLPTTRMTTFESETPEWLSEYTNVKENIVPEGRLMK